MFPGTSGEISPWAGWLFYLLITWLFVVPFVAAIVTGGVAGWFFRGVSWWGGALMGIPAGIVGLIVGLICVLIWFAAFPGLDDDKIIVAIPFFMGTAATCGGLVWLLWGFGRGL